MAGGVKDEGRFPWDPPDGPPTEKEEAVLARANTRGSGIGGTTPVAMYPLGISKPNELMDLAGNVWEWTETEEGGGRVLRGGSGPLSSLRPLRVPLRGGPSYSLSLKLGFRLVSPIGSGS